MDQFIIQTANGVASFHHSIHQKPSRVILNFRQGIQVVLVLCPGGTAGDELECVKVVVEKVHHPGGFLVRHLRELLKLLLQTPAGKGLLKGPITLYQLLGRLSHQSVKQCLLVRIVAVNRSSCYSKRGCYTF